MIRDATLAVASQVCPGRMPTKQEMYDFLGTHSLSAAITKREGGFDALAQELNLTRKESEATFAHEMERRAATILTERGYSVTHMSAAHPYDLLADGVKIDVKASRETNFENRRFFQFFLSKKDPTCDVYMLFTIGSRDEILNTYIIPSKFAKQKHITIGIHRSRYNRFRERYDYIDTYRDFLRNIT